MKLPVELGPSSHIRLTCERVAIFFCPPKRLCRHVRHGQFQCARLQHGSHFEDLLDFGLRNTFNDSATVALEFHQAFGFKALERLPNRYLADIEQFRDVVLANGFPLIKLTCDDGFPYVLRNKVRGRRREADRWQTRGVQGQ